MALFRTKNLVKQFPGGVTALAGLTLHLEPGEILGFLGPNGAGKTTTVRLLNGSLSPSSGSIDWSGPLAGSDEARAQRTATLGEQAQLYAELSLDENLDFYGRLYGLNPARLRQRADQLTAQLGLEAARRRPVGTYSTGMKKKAQLARCLLHEPALLFLDEPTSGLDPEAAREVTRLIKDTARQQGAAVLLCTHNLPQAEQIADRYVFLSQGRLLAEGTKAALLAGRPLTLRLRHLDGRLETRIGPDEAALAEHLRQAVESGARLVEARVEEPSLEELYFSILGAAAPESRP